MSVQNTFIARNGHAYNIKHENTLMINVDENYQNCHEIIYGTKGHQIMTKIQRLQT